MRSTVIFMLICSIATLLHGAKLKVAVMEINDQSQRFSEDTLYNATEMLRGYLTSSKQYLVIDKSRQQQHLKKLIKEQKRESYKACYDKNCQIPLGQALSADSILRPTISCLGNNCLFSMEMIDLAREASVGGASVDFNYLESDASPLLTALRSAVDKLTEKNDTSGKTDIDLSRSILMIKTEPSGVLVRVYNNKFDNNCVSPCSMKNIETGKYNLQFSGDHVKSKSTMVSVKNRGMQYVTEKLKKQNNKHLAKIKSALDNKDYASLKQLLSQRESNINHQDEKGKTFLMKAAEMNDITAVKIFIRFGADRYIADKKGRTAFDYAAQGSEVDNFLNNITESDTTNGIIKEDSDFSFMIGGLGISSLLSVQVEFPRIYLFETITLSLFSLSINGDKAAAQLLNPGIVIYGNGISGFEAGIIASLKSAMQNEEGDDYGKYLVRPYTAYHLNNFFTFEAGAYIPLSSGSDGWRSVFYLQCLFF